MKYAAWLGVASIVLFVTSCAPSVYNSGTPASSRYADATDFNGDWQLVSNRSDGGRSWLDERNRFGLDDWGTTEGTNERYREGTNDRSRYGGWFLPDDFRISGNRDLLRIEDESGGLLTEVDLNGDRTGSYRDRDETYGRSTHARWISDRRFEVERTGRNRRITQTFALQNRGRQLVVSTQIERDGGTRSFTRVYNRV